jgi:hypothetical protein
MGRGRPDGDRRAALSADILYTFGINRIRHFYTEALPEIQDYFVLSTHDDIAGGLLSMGVVRGRLQILFTIPCLVGVLNTIVTSVLVALATSWFLGWPMAGAAALGLLAAVGAGTLQYRYMMPVMAQLNGRMTPIFPTAPGIE